MKNILHIENSGIIVKIAKETIKGLNINYINLKTITETIDYLKKNKIDLIITNFELEDGNAINLIDKINAIDSTKNIPILVLSSYNNFEKKQELFAKGIIDFIPKNENSAKHIKKYISELLTQDSLIKQLKETSIAVIDDDKTILKIFRYIFNKYQIYNVDYFNCGNDFLNSPKEYLINISDIMLPDVNWNGIFLSKKLENKISIAMSGTLNYRIISSLLLNGVNDFIQKPFDSNIFFIKLKKNLQLYLLENIIKKKNKELHTLAMTDSLTKLYNHNKILNLLDHNLIKAKKNNVPITVAMLDIDFFKKVNDTYGHQIGDELLIELSNLLQKNTKNKHYIGRYGGEEFLLLLIDFDIEKSKKIISYLLNEIRKTIFTTIKINITISVGLSQNKKNDTVEEIIKRADKALYKAKDSGRDRFKTE